MPPVNVSTSIRITKSKRETSVRNSHEAKSEEKPVYYIIHSENSSATNSPRSPHSNSLSRSGEAGSDKLRNNKHKSYPVSSSLKIRSPEQVFSESIRTNKHKVDAVRRALDEDLNNNNTFGSLTKKKKVTLIVNESNSQQVAKPIHDSCPRHVHRQSAPAGSIVTSPVVNNNVEKKSRVSDVEKKSRVDNSKMSEVKFVSKTNKTTGKTRVDGCVRSNSARDFPSSSRHFLEHRTVNAYTSRLKNSPYVVNHFHGTTSDGMSDLDSTDFDTDYETTDCESSDADRLYFDTGINFYDYSTEAPVVTFLDTNYNSDTGTSERRPMMKQDTLSARDSPCDARSSLCDAKNSPSPCRKSMSPEAERRRQRYSYYKEPSKRHRLPDVPEQEPRSSRYRDCVRRTASFRRSFRDAKKRLADMGKSISLPGTPTTKRVTGRFVDRVRGVIKEKSSSNVDERPSKRNICFADEFEYDETTQAYSTNSLRLALRRPICPETCPDKALISRDRLSLDIKRALVGVNFVASLLND